MQRNGLLLNVEKASTQKLNFHSTLVVLVSMLHLHFLPRKFKVIENCVRTTPDYFQNNYLKKRKSDIFQSSKKIIADTQKRYFNEVLLDEMDQLFPNCLNIPTHLLEMESIGTHFIFYHVATM